MSSAEEKLDQSRRPEDTNFKQQRLKAWQPLLTPPWVIGTFFVITCIFIPIGVAIVVASEGIVEVKFRYDNHPACTTGAAPITCSVDLTIPKDMNTPIYFYYELHNFYQNHRRYVKSRSDKQLSGSDLSQTTDCDPLQSNDANGLKVYPCGLIANSFFNDTFVASLNGAPLSWERTGIAWKSDVETKFKIPDGQNTSEVELNKLGLTRQSPNGFTLPEVTDEEFMVWMRTAGLPDFKKLHRKITSLADDKLKAGDVVSINITNNYNVQDFSGEKYIVLSTTAWIGGKNEFLGYAYIAVGALTFLLGIVFLIKHCVSPRPLGDMNAVSFK